MIEEGGGMSDGLSKPAPDVFEAARTRRSVRAYRPDAVPVETVREIVALGRHAPSGSNIQPWRVHVVTGLPQVLFRTEHTEDSFSGKGRSRIVGKGLPTYGFPHFRGELK